ncbi:uncharacterized protein LOC132087993 [Daphnia carinata]|uniref:uncharacterized protein LOC132087993 n=1 Tax=Daphnia carinata TaxID=120202 RepID=UPI002868881C|nr:uncharacterized protein LOC132087993 [Daphnia carinata]
MEAECFVDTVRHRTSILTIGNKCSLEHEQTWVVDSRGVVFAGTGGLYAEDLTAQHRWFVGPVYLETSANWPRHPSLPPIDPDDPEIRSASWIGLVRREEEVFRTLAYVRRWIGNTQSNQDNRLTGELVANEIQQVREFLFRRAQGNAYQQEIVDLREGNRLSPASSLLKLSPYLDHRGLLCIGGRIEKAPLPTGTRHPKERLTELILLDLHRDRAHLSAEQIHHEAWKQFWIAKGRITAQRIWNLCYTCRKYKAKGSTPKMADLPTALLSPGLPAFTHTGVDYWGPMEVTIFRRTVKR